MALRPKDFSRLGCYVSRDPVETGGGCLNIPYRNLTMSELRDLVGYYAPTNKEIEADTDDPSIQQAIDEGWIYGQAREITVRHQAARSVKDGLAMLPTVSRTITSGSPFNGVTAYMIGGGPSLARNVDDLKGRGPIIATNSAVKTLDDAGIMPDIIMCADGLIGAYAEAVKTKAWRHAEIWAAFGVHRSIWEDVDVWIPMSAVPFGRWYMAVTGAAGIASGGSVSTLIVSVLDHLGADRVVLVGQDCALSQSGDMHAGKDRHIINGDLISDGHGKEYLRVTSEAWGGIGRVDATQQLANYRWWLESFSKQTRMETINATEGGARINGWDEVRLSDVEDEYQTLPTASDPAVDVSQALRDDLADMPEIISRAERLASALDELIDAGSSCQEIMHKDRSQLAAGLATGGPEESGLWVANERLAMCAVAARRLATTASEGMDLMDVTIAALEES